MKILFITMYAPPLNLVPVKRMNIWFEALEKESAQYDLYTRSYNEEDHNTNDLLVGCKPSKHHYVENKHHGKRHFFSFNSRSKKLEISKVLPPGVKGIYNWSQVDVYHHDFFDSCVEEIKKSRKDYELVVLSYGPPIILKLAKYLKEYLGVKVLVDFRDAFITERDSGRLLKQKIKVLNRCLDSVDYLTFASPGVKDFTMRFLRSKIPSSLVLNGVVKIKGSLNEQEMTIKSEIQRFKTEGYFCFIHTGALYKGQQLGLLCDTISNWGVLRQRKVKHIFIGLSTYQPSIEGAVIYPKVTAFAAREFQKIADGLLLPVWEGRYTGFSAKMIEYLFSGKVILCGAGPQRDLSDFLNTSPNAFVLNNEADSILDQLMEQDFRPKEHDPSIYARSEQVDAVVHILKKLS